MHPYIAFSSFDDIDETIEDLVKKIASWTPLTTAATWLNWIIVRTTVSLTTHRVSTLFPTFHSSF